MSLKRIFLFFSDENELSRFNNKFDVEALFRFSDQHLWLSIFDCPRGSRFDRVHRFVCCLAFVSCVLCLNCIFFGLMNVPSQFEYLMGRSQFRVTDVAVSVVVTVIGFAISTLLFETIRCSQLKVSEISS